VLLLLLIAALTLQELPKEFLDRKVREGKEQTGTALDELTMGQLLKLTAMPSARLSQMQCTGYALWLRQHGEPTLPSERLDAVHAALGRDAASFGEMKGEVGLAFVAVYAEEAAEKTKALSADEFAAWRKAEDARCGGFFKSAGDGSLKLRPLAHASVIDPVLNGCHAAYRAAAARNNGDERASLARMADRAAALALEGKSGNALAAARAALDEEAASAALAPVLDAEAEMMQLALCVPKLKRRGGR
jgi:hypothetical protein